MNRLAPQLLHLPDTSAEWRTETPPRGSPKRGQSGTSPPIRPWLHSTSLPAPPRLHATVAAVRTSEAAWSRSRFTGRSGWFEQTTPRSMRHPGIGLSLPASRLGIPSLTRSQAHWTTLVMCFGDVLTRTLVWLVLRCFDQVRCDFDPQSVVPRSVSPRKK